jgi:hypothetical protein
MVLLSGPMARALRLANWSEFNAGRAYGNRKYNAVVAYDRSHGPLRKHLERAVVSDGKLRTRSDPLHR